MTTSISGLKHALKWSPFVAVFACILLSDLSQAPPSYGGGDGRLSFYDPSEFEIAQNLAASFPSDVQLQINAAIMLSVHRRNDEALVILNTLMKKHPDNASGNQILGEIYKSRGEYDTALICFQTALINAESEMEQKIANHSLGEIDMIQKRFDSAVVHFRDALEIDPEFKPSILALKSLDAAAAPQ